MDNLEKVTLSNIGNGAAAELFNHELTRVLENISDPNTDADQTRKITLEFVIKPSPDRNMGSIAIKCSAKTAGVKPAAGSMYIVQKGNKTEGYRSDTKQIGMELGILTSINGANHA